MQVDIPTFGLENKVKGKRGILSGKKTIITGVISVLSGIAFYLAGVAEFAEAWLMVTGGFGAIFLRKGTAKEAESQATKIKEEIMEAVGTPENPQSEPASSESEGV